MTGEQILPERPAEGSAADAPEGGEKLSKKALVSQPAFSPLQFLSLTSPIEEAREGEGEGREKKSVGSARNRKKSRSRCERRLEG